MKRRILSIFVALAMCVSLLPTVALADGVEIDPEGGNSIVFDGGGMNEPSDEPTNEPTDEGETEDFDEKDEATDPDEGEEAHECVFVDGWCECGKEEPAAPPIAQPLGAYALRTMSIDPEGEPVVQDEQDRVSYIDADGEEQNCETYTVLTKSTTSLDAGWYVVEENVTITDNLTIAENATVHIILCDDATLTLSGGLDGTKCTKLHIYGQSEGENVGEMVVSGPDSNNNDSIAINMGDGALVINSGKVTATGGKVTATGSEAKYSYGIRATSALTVYGGELTATGGNVNAKNDKNHSSYGIYQNAVGTSASLTVNGGTLEAKGGDMTAGDSYGIYQNSNGNLQVSGGKVTAIGGKVTAIGGEAKYSYGIYKSGGSIFIKGGTVKAEGVKATKNSYGIQQAPSGGNLTVKGGKLTAIGGEVTGNNGGSFGINAEGALMLEKGELTATGGAANSSYGIYAAKALTVEDGTLKAEGGSVGNGTYSYGIYAKMDLKVSGESKVTATGGIVSHESYGILASGALTVEDGTLKAEGGKADGSSCGIFQNSTGNLTVSGEGKVTATGGEANLGSYGINQDNVYVNLNLTVSGGTLEAKGGKVGGGVSCGIFQRSTGNLTVSGTGKVTATGGEAKYSYGIYKSGGASILIKGGTVTATGGTATGENSESYDITTKGALTVSGGTVQSADGGAAVLLCANAENGSVTVSGGSMKLAQDSVMQKVSVSGSVKLLDLVNEGDAYQKKDGSAFVKAVDVNELTDGVIVQACKTHSTNSGVCAYCGKNITPAPTPGGGSSGGSSSSGVSSSSSSSSSSVKVPASSDHGTVNISASVSKGTASVSLSQNQINQVISDGKTDVSIDVSGLKNVESAKLPANIISAANDAKDISLTVSLPTGSVSLDDQALASLPHAKDVTVSVEKRSVSNLTAAQKAAIGEQAEAALVVDVNILVGSAKQSDFGGGKLTISVPYTPKEGEDTSKLTVWFIKDDGTIENMGGYYDAEKGCFVFETEHLSKYILVNLKETKAEESEQEAPREEVETYAPANFLDVSENAYYADAVAWAVENGIVSGIDENNFGSDLSCTRAQLVTFLWRVANKPAANGEMDFTDVQEDAYYSEPICWAASMGIVSGYGNGLFGTDDTITREQMAVILYRFAQTMGMDTTQGGMAIREFADYESISGYALQAMQWAVNAGILHGDNNSLMPEQPCSRAQIVAMLYRMMGQA